MSHDHMYTVPLYLSIRVDKEGVIAEELTNHGQEDCLQLGLCTLTFTELVIVKTDHLSTVRLEGREEGRREMWAVGVWGREMGEVCVWGGGGG